MPREEFVNVSIRREARDALKKLSVLLNMTYSDLLVYIAEVVEENKWILSKLEEKLEG